MRYKLSTRLQKSLDDLRKVEKDPKLKVDMGIWAGYDYDLDADGCRVKHEFCSVCHAGSVLAKSINGEQFKKIINAKHTFAPYKNWGHEWTAGIRDAGFLDFLQGVNELREGDFHGAQIALDLPDDFFDGFILRKEVPSYNDDPRGYKRYFQRVINYVKKRGY